MRVAGSSSDSKTFAWAFREAEHEKASKVPTLRRMEVLGVQVMVLHTVLFEVAPDASAWVSDCFCCRIMAIVCVIVRRCDGVSAPRWPCDVASTVTAQTRQELAGLLAMAWLSCLALAM